MKVRTFVSGALALALLTAGGIATSARADEDPPVDLDVAGGVAGIQAVVTVGGTLSQTVFKKDYAELSVVTPRTQLPDDGSGGEFSAGGINQTVGPVKVKALFETISGHRNGAPYFAHGESHLTGIDIQGTKIAALEVTCTWDRDGGHGATTLLGAGGAKNMPPANQAPTNIPGLGTLRFNEQYTTNDSHYDTISERWIDTQTIYVFGAHLVLSKAAQATYGVVDVILGFTSCDPTLPNLSGLKLNNLLPSD